MINITQLSTREVGILCLTYPQMVAYTKSENLVDLAESGYSDAFINLFMSAKGKWYADHPGKTVNPPKNPPPINQPVWRR